MQLRRWKAPARSGLLFCTLALFAVLAYGQPVDSARSETETTGDKQEQPHDPTPETPGVQLQAHRATFLQKLIVANTYIFADNVRLDYRFAYSCKALEDEELLDRVDSESVTEILQRTEDGTWWAEPEYNIRAFSYGTDPCPIQGQSSQDDIYLVFEGGPLGMFNTEAVEPELFVIKEHLQ